ncbi:MAG: ChbG/HpnK family deacetylase [Sedimentisphaerales bacterium]
MNFTNVKKLIVNADDFGLSKGTTDAIIDCHINGIITSATLMSNMPAAEYAISRAKAFPNLSIGLHLNLTEGKPLTDPDKVDNLIDFQGNFLAASKQHKNLLSNDKAKEQVYRELEAQLLRALDLGVHITHFDSHNGTHRRPAVRAALIKLHKLYGIPAARTNNGLYWTAPNANIYCKLEKILLNFMKFRRANRRAVAHSIMRKDGLLTPDRFITLAYLIPTPPKGLKERVIQCLKALPYGTSEMGFHPKYNEQSSDELPAFNEFDAQVLCDNDIKNCIKENNIKLISFSDLQ